MKDFKSNNRFGGNRDRGGNRFGGRDSGRPSYGNKPSFDRNNDRGGMFQATCAQCGKVCEVPFKPNGKKPVYCNDCFGKSSGAPQEGGFARKEYTPKSDYQKPSFQRPSFDRGNEDLKRSLDSLGEKLDMLIRMVGKQATPIVSETMPAKAPKTSKEPNTVALKKAVKKATAPKKTIKKKTK